MTTEHRPFADEGELTASLNAIRNQIAANREQSKEQMDRIEEQTVKTNGRVRGLETWRAFITGAIAILGVMSGWVMFLLSTGHLR